MEAVMSANGFALNRGRFNREMGKRGLVHPRGGKLSGRPNATALAKQMRMDRSTVSRVINDEALPGAEFVLKLIAAWDLEFHDLFKTASPTPRRLQVPQRRQSVAA